MYCNFFFFFLPLLCGDDNKQIIIIAENGSFYHGWLPRRGKAQMACNYCFPTGTIFQIDSEFRKKGTFRWENRTSCLVGLKTHPTIVPRLGIELTTSSLHSFIMAKVSHALNPWRRSPPCSSVVHLLSWRSLLSQIVFQFALGLAVRSCSLGQCRCRISLQCLFPRISMAVSTKETRTFCLL